MKSTTDISVLELLSSKICHDLISPIGAVNNGLELMSELGEDAGDEALELVAYSAQQASAKLQAYRMAYGIGGADSALKPEDVYKVIEGIVAPDEKIKQDWDPYGDLGYEERPGAFCKILVCTILLAMECMPKGGVIFVVAAEAGQTAVKACGPDAGLRENMAEALELSLSPQELKPQQTHPYMTGLLAQSYDFKISVGEIASDSVTFLLSLPSASSV